MIFDPYEIKTPEESNYLIAYIDILGTKEIISGSDGKEFFKLIHETLALATKGFIQSKGWGFDDLEFKIFSDNLLVAIQCEKNKLQEAFQTLSDFLTMLLIMFVYKGVFFRGGITYGKLAIDDTIVWGKGLIDAVQLEEQIAIYPRIVLSDSLVNLLDSFLKENESFNDVYSCFTDFDGCVYLDYIYYDEKSTDSILEESNKFTDEKISVTNKPRVLHKYLWHKNYLKLVKEKYDSLMKKDSNENKQ